jgi:hypothetical protein
MKKPAINLVIPMQMSVEARIGLYVAVADTKIGTIKQCPNENGRLLELENGI